MGWKDTGEKCPVCPPRIRVPVRAPLPALAPLPGGWGGGRAGAGRAAALPALESARERKKSHSGLAEIGRFWRDVCQQTRQRAGSLSRP